MIVKVSGFVFDLKPFSALDDLMNKEQKLEHFKKMVDAHCKFYTTQK